MVQGGGGRGAGEAGVGEGVDGTCQVFVLLMHGETILHRVETPSLTLHDDIIFVGCDAI